jgi:predicted PurR-regulated permease PerM
MEVSTERSASAAAGPRGDPAVNRAMKPVHDGQAPKLPPVGDGSDRVRPMALFRWGLFASLGVLATAAAAAAVYTARAVLIRALIALFLAVSLDPAVRLLTRWHLRRGLAVLVIIVVSLGLAAAFLQSVIPAMVSQFDALVKDFPGYLASLQHRSASFRELSDRFHLTRQIETLLAGLPARLSSGLLSLSGRLFSALVSTLIVAVLTIYFMADLPRLRRGVVLLFPRAHRAQVGRISDVLIDNVGAYMVGNIVVSIVAGVAAFAALTGFGVPFAVPLAFVVAVTDLIPMIGATLGAAACVLVALLATSVWPTTVLVAAFFVLYQQLENYLMAPQVMRSAVRLSPTAVLLAALIGGAALGLVGALMAIPIAAGVTVLLSERLPGRDAPNTGNATEGDSVTASRPELNLRQERRRGDKPGGSRQSRRLPRVPGGQGQGPVG